MSETKPDGQREAFLDACVWHGFLDDAKAILAARLREKGGTG